MKIEAKNFENRAENALRQCLGKIPIVQIDDIQKEAVGVVCSDFRVTLTVSGIKQILVLEVRKSGQPREARAAINSLLRCLSANTGAYGIFIAPFITPRTAEICRQEGIGYIDFAGNCLLAFPGIFIEQSGNSNPMLEKRDLRSLYSPKAARVLRVVLNNPQKSWKTQDLADEADADEDQWSKLFGFKEVDSGANVTLLLPYDAGVYYGAKNKEGVRVVSPVQLYLDLIGFRGRGEEAANMLLEEVIKPLW